MPGRATKMRHHPIAVKRRLCGDGCTLSARVKRRRASARYPGGGYIYKEACGGGPIPGAAWWLRCAGRCKARRGGYPVEDTRRIIYIRRDARRRDTMGAAALAYQRGGLWCRSAAQRLPWALPGKIFFLSARLEIARLGRIQRKFF